MMPSEHAENSEAAARAIRGRDADALNELGQRAGDAGDLTAAVACFRASMALGGEGAAHNLGIALTKLGRYGAAAEAYRFAAERGVEDARLNLANLLVDHLDDPVEAEREYRVLVAAGDAVAMFNLGLLCVAQGRNDEAVELFREASERGDGEASEHLADLLAESGAPADASRAYQLAVDQGNDGARIELALHLARQGDVDGARHAFRQAIDDAVPDAVNSYGTWLADRGQAAEAEALYRDALDDGDASVWRNLGNLLADDASRREEALTAYLTAIVHGDEGAWVNVGVLLAEMGRLDEAVHVLKQAAADGDSFALEALPDALERLHRVEPG
jgi:tetratricopeptide (TPR) repeat protein